MKIPDGVLDECGRTVYRIALVKTASEELSRDITQQVFLILFEKKPLFDDFHALRVWMIRTAVKLIANHFRKSENIRTVSLDDSRDIAVTDRLEFELCDLLSVLPDIFRETVVLYYIDNMPIKEIAKALGISQGTVKSRLSRARDQLSKIYKEELL